MRMEKSMGYLPPEIEVQRVFVEQGFSLSNMEQIDRENEEIEW